MTESSGKGPVDFEYQRQEFTRLTLGNKIRRYAEYQSDPAMGAPENTAARAALEKAVLEDIAVALHARRKTLGRQRIDRELDILFGRIPGGQVRESDILAGISPENAKEIRRAIDRTPLVAMLHRAGTPRHLLSSIAAEIENRAKSERAMRLVLDSLSQSALFTLKQMTAVLAEEMVVWVRSERPQKGIGAVHVAYGHYCTLRLEVKIGMGQMTVTITCTNLEPDATGLNPRIGTSESIVCEISKNNVTWKRASEDQRGNVSQRRIPPEDGIAQLRAFGKTFVRRVSAGI